MVMWENRRVKLENSLVKLGCTMERMERMECSWESWESRMEKLENRKEMLGSKTGWLESSLGM